MQINELLKDPVYQLNLLLWMAKDQPENEYRVFPLFHKLGFEIIYIENPFLFPDEIVIAIKNSDLEISNNPEPDLILGRDKDKKALYFEAKANNFEPVSSNAKQARAHLIAAGPVFSEVLRPYESCLLCYVLPEKASQLMPKC